MALPYQAGVLSLLNHLSFYCCGLLFSLDCSSYNLKIGQRHLCVNTRNDKLDIVVEAFRTLAIKRSPIVFTRFKDERNGKQKYS